MNAIQLTCEYAENPIGIDTASPRFSWTLDATARGASQAAYRILVASSAEQLDASAGDKWDSGKFRQKPVAHLSGIVRNPNGSRAKGSVNREMMVGWAVLSHNLWAVARLAEEAGRGVGGLQVAGGWPDWRREPAAYPTRALRLHRVEGRGRRQLQLVLV